MTRPLPPRRLRPPPLVILATLGAAMLGQPALRAQPNPTARLGERTAGADFALPLDAPPVALRDGSGEIGLAAAGCGGCHRAIYDEWRQTSHAFALGDPQFLAELSKPESPRWLCLSCHTPLSAQRTERLTAETPLVGASAAAVGQPAALVNPDFDPDLAREGITCATCHVRRDADGRGTILGPRGGDGAPHRVRRDPEALHGICVRCHDPGPVQLTPQFTCWFETARELVAGSATPPPSCPTCHMPATERSVATGAPTRSTRRHVWLGGGPPKTRAGFDTWLARGFTPGFTLKVLRPPVGAEATAGEHRLTAMLQVGAGHRVPTADPERFLRVRASLLRVSGGSVPEELAATHHDLGQRWDFGDAATDRPARKLSDDRLKPGEVRSLNLRLPAVAGATHLRVEVLHVRLTPENAAWAQRTPVPASVEALWPGAAAAVARLPETYPLAAVVARHTLPLAGGAPEVAPPQALVTASRALMDLPPETLRRLLQR